MRRWYLKTLDLVGFVSVIANTTLLTNAHFFLVTFLGKGSNKWLPAMASLQILCIYGIIRAMTEPLANCILALGRTRTMLQANLLAGAVELVLLLLVLRSGKIELVSLVVLFAYTVPAVVYVPFLRNNLGISGGDLLGSDLARISRRGWRLSRNIAFCPSPLANAACPCGQGTVHRRSSGSDSRPLHWFSLLPGS